MALAISARDGSLNFYVWNPKVRILNDKEMHDFAVFSLDNNTLKTFHAKSIIDIMKNLNPAVHKKIMLLTGQYISKGANTMVTDYEVKNYEYIIDYFDTDDSTDELEILVRMRFEKEWDGIPPHLQKRILAVDKIVLERYADYFDYQLFKDYIKLIRNRLQIESSCGILPQNKKSSCGILPQNKNKEEHS